MITASERLNTVLDGQKADRPPCICPGGMMNMVTVGLQDEVSVFFPEAHCDAQQMAALAKAVYDRGFFENYGERLRAGGSLTYAFDIGLGSNYLALLAYYLSGPLHIFAFLIPQGWMIEFITYLIVLKIGACGFTMAWYLSKRYDTRHFGIAFCGVCYALSGYLAAYSWNIMWLDVLWLAPIVLYGLEQLVEKDKPFLYCISLGLAILCNYYISIMLCIFLVFYFLCRMVCLPRVGWKRVLLKFFNFGFNHR